MRGGEDELPTRTYNWIDEVPAEITVIIGHDVIATDRIVERRGALGGRVLFCDTGAGKGGKLSAIDMPRPA
jgi:protein phosphatase